MCIYVHCAVLQKSAVAHFLVIGDLWLWRTDGNYVTECKSAGPGGYYYINYTNVELNMCTTEILMDQGKG